MKAKIVDYKLYDYEKEFLRKEIISRGGSYTGLIDRDKEIDIKGISEKDALNLTFISKVLASDGHLESVQYLRESVNGNSRRVQSKRYGPHGLHEYKGRFNPQIPRSIIFTNFPHKSALLDPFMGSGTTIIEALDLGHRAFGSELNPFAFFLAKAKVYYEQIDEIPVVKIKKHKAIAEDERSEYLKNWFPEKQLEELEDILYSINDYPEKEKVVLQVILSNLLREHSFQNPGDLRIRRRAEVPQDLDLGGDFLKSLEAHRKKHFLWKELIARKNGSEIFNIDSRFLGEMIKEKIDGTVSSPPYASALPYVDTYRLSMVALGLIKPKDINRKEKELIGARDVNKNDMTFFKDQLSVLPKDVQGIINDLRLEIESDKEAGFRRQAVPYSLIRYATSMLDVLKEIYKIERVGAKNFWVLGPNKVKVNKKWKVLDTVHIIGSLAKHAGFKEVTYTPIQSYSRYDIHSKNSINEESVLSFSR